MQRRPDGRARLLLAYRSVGEAERYRPYWQQEWYDPAAKPAWLGKENRRWAGNFAVQFWQPEWQKLIFCSWCFTPYRPVLAGLDLSVFSSLIPGSIQLCFISCYRVG